VSVSDSELQCESKCGIELQWFPNREQCERGKPLDTIFAIDNAMTRDPIQFIVFLFEGNQFVLEVATWKLVSNHVGCKTLIATPCHTSGRISTEENIAPDTPSLTPFKRVVIQVRPTQEQFGKLVTELEETSKAHPVSTIAEVLSDALEFTVTHADLAFDSKMKKLAEFPNLLYQLPDSLRKTAFQGIAFLLDSYWKRAVLYDNKYDSIIVSESKKLLCELIAAGHDQTHVALISHDHLRYMTMLITDKTKHGYQALSVEKSNFHTIFRTIEGINKETSISFCSVQVAGRLSGLDISRLVDQSIHGNVRVLLVYTPQVLLSLQMTQKVDSIRIPTSLRRAHQIKTSQYTTSTVIGKLILKAHEKFSSGPVFLHSEVNAMYDMLLQRTQWQNDFRAWLLSFQGEQKEARQIYSLLICEDMAYVRKRLEILRKSLHALDDYAVHMHTMDCHVVDAEVELARYFAPKDTKKDVKKIQEANFLILLNAHLLSENHRHHIASVSIAANYNIVLAYPSYNPETLVLQIKIPNTNQTKTLRGALWRPIAEWDAVHGTELEIEKRALSMFFGPLVKTSLFASNFAKDSAKTHLADTCEFLKVDNKIINQIVDTIFAEAQQHSMSPVWHFWSLILF
jgi:hypothetical protein